MHQPLSHLSSLPALLLRSVLLCVVGVAVTLGAPILRGAGLFEEHHEHVVGALGYFPGQQAVQTENRRRQPTLLPSALARRARAAVSVAIMARPRRQSSVRHLPQSRAPPVPVPCAVAA